MEGLLERNLAALSRVDERTAQAVRAAAPVEGLEWAESRQGGDPTAALMEGGRRVTLASRHRPAEEGRRLAATADLDEHGAIVVLGFGLGYHVVALAERVRGRGVLVVYEPDAGLLRAVLERLDYAGLLGDGSVVLLAGDVEGSDLTRRLESRAGLIVQGVQFISHAATRGRRAEAVRAFTEQFARLVAYCRTNLATTLVHAAVTCRNLAHNLGRYAAGATVNELKGAAAGRPAVLVAAGPSLARNVHLLAEPGVRERVVIIAAQTVLKPLLERGVRPHFVTALDYHEISRRFYEGLPERLDEVTLVAEPKVHPAVLDHYPGPIRVLRSRFLDRLLGSLARPIDALPAGTTVAHLSFYLAQHLGCDPIILVGQDLGFTDGLYYCPGTAIHDVWAPELNVFNTLEMMEWKRIARHKRHLRRRPAPDGRMVHTDEQMLTYLGQFERDFAAAEQRVIDATEGGVAKRGVEEMRLGEALEGVGNCKLEIGNWKLQIGERGLDLERLEGAAGRVRERIGQVGELREASRRTVPILRKMVRDQRDRRRMESHFGELAAERERVAELGDVLGLVNDLNQVGAYKRVRADRALRVRTADGGGDGYERQAAQLRRDIENVEWLIEGCDEAERMFSEALERVEAQLGTVEAVGDF